MSILIKDMEMPKKCLECPLYDTYNYYCTLYSFGIPARHNRDGSTRPEWCELEELPSAQPEQRWIPVTERLPEEGTDVLITKEPFKIKGYEQNVIRAKRSVDPRSGKIEWWSPGFGALTNKAVLAWMPLPEPYKVGEKDE